MHFVNDVDFVARRDRRIAHTIEQLTHIGHACARGGIELQHIRVAALHNGGAMFACWLKLYGGAILGVGTVIQAAGEQARCGGFADTAHTGQHEGMGNAARFKCI